ncbi:MAG: UDP binding domain-containing protein, partial [Candidatus Hodarchaeota archaeon]
ILGLAFKPNTDDMRKAQSIVIINELINRGVQKITGYDPYAKETARKEFGDKINYASSIEECLRGADACILVTEWDEFKDLTPDTFKSNMRTPILIDGRRIYEPDLFSKHLTYRAIGRG